MRTAPGGRDPRHHAAGGAGLRRDVPVLRDVGAGRLRRGPGGGAGVRDRRPLESVRARDPDRRGLPEPREDLARRVDPIRVGAVRAGRRRGSGAGRRADLIWGCAMNLRSLLGLLFSAALLAFFFWSTDVRAMGAPIREANFLLILPAVAIYFVGVWLRAARWRLLV